MPPWVYFACATLLASVACVLLVIRFSRRHRPGSFCPGPERTWAEFVRPTTWFAKGRCGYDLRSASGDEEGFVLCPECGRRSDRKRLLRTPWVFRLGTFGVLVLMLAGGVGLWPEIRSGEWVRRVPGPLMVATRRIAGTRMPPLMRREIWRRIAQEDFALWERRHLARTFVHELGDDDVRENAIGATHSLWLLGAAARPELERALHSPDWQRRQLAADTLRDDAGYVPSNRMFEVCVEALRDDCLPSGTKLNADGTMRYSHSGFANARSAAPYLERYAYRASSLLREGMRSADSQQRLLCAAIAGFGGRVELLDEAGPILISHLRDNKVFGDARVAAPALARFGPGAMEFVRPHLESPDEQLRDMSRLIAARVDPSLPRPDLKAMARVTSTRRDPTSATSILETGFGHLAMED